MKTQTKRPTLDHNGQIPVDLQSRTDGKFEIIVDLKRITSRHLLGKDGHFRGGGLDARVDGKVINSNVTYNKADQTLHLTVDASTTAKRFALTVYNEPIIDWVRNSQNKWEINQATPYNRLTASELRILGTSEVCPPNIPTPRKKFAGFDASKHAPITDLHTHSSAQISAHEFMELGLAHEIDYPVELLDKLGITLSEQERAHVRADGQGLRFDPTINEKLACEQGKGTYEVIPLSQLSKKNRDKIERQLHVPQDATLCFSDFDAEMYRFLNPFSKNPALAKPIIHKIGASYAASGIRYSELSTGAMLQANKEGKAEWFREMVEAVEEVEKEHGVKLRFLVGIPRDKKPHEVLGALEKIKYAARHPYIVGVDVLGYEDTKAKELSWAMEHITDWARTLDSDLNAGDGWDFKRDFIVRTHAGETEKNDGNVAESVRIAEASGIRVRIAHAVHEKPNEALDARIRKITSRDPWALGFEFCPTSNIAYNNVVAHEEVPIKRWIKLCKNWFLGSDGAGSVQSTPTQLALDGLAAGLTIADLQHLRENELNYIQDEKTRHTKKTEAFSRHYGASKAEATEKFFQGFEAHLQYVKELTDPDSLDPKSPKLPHQFNKKIPITIAGAGGTSWQASMTDASRAEAAHAIPLLVAALDPKEVYYACGRAKEEGVTKVLGNAIRYQKESNPENRPALLSLNTAAITDIAPAIDWIVPMPGDTSRIAKNTIDFMQNNPLQGLSIFIGGGSTTGQMIAMCTRDPKAKFLLMENAGGASQRYASRFYNHRKFSDRYILVQRAAEALQELYPDRNLFREGVNPFDNASLQALEKRMAEERKPNRKIAGGGISEERFLVTAPTATPGNGPTPA